MAVITAFNSSSDCSEDWGIKWDRIWYTELPPGPGCMVILSPKTVAAFVDVHFICGPHISFSLQIWSRGLFNRIRQANYDIDYAILPKRVFTKWILIWLGNSFKLTLPLEIGLVKAFRSMFYIREANAALCSTSSLRLWLMDPSFYYSTIIL